MNNTKDKKESGPEKETPLMKQFNSIKAKHPDAILLFRVGDFYETFGQDAVRASKVLGIVLTARNNGNSKLELAGFPHHSMDNYLPKLVRAGYRVAVCDQLEDPKMAKGIVKRGVTELVTPGVAMSDTILDQRSNNFLAAVHFDKTQAGVAFLDISTGEFMAAEGSHDYVDQLMQGLDPKEVLVCRGDKHDFLNRYHVFNLDEWAFQHAFGYEKLIRHFGTASLKGFGIEDLTLSITAAGVILHYLADTQHERIKHITKIARLDRHTHMWLDRFTVRNLELFGTQGERGIGLLDVIDQSSTPMGSRLMRRWVALPLCEIHAIRKRQEVVGALIEEQTVSEKISSGLNRVGDVERMVSRLAAGRISPRELVQLSAGLGIISEIRNCCVSAKSKALQALGDQLSECSLFRERVGRVLVTEPAAAVGKGNVIAVGVDHELDELRAIATGGKDYLLRIQEQESQRTGISSLKVGFNNVFGYYLEVTHAHKNKVPSEWIRKQTLTNAERYITEELKNYETKILNAEERMLSIETRLFEALVTELMDYVESIQTNAATVARLDCLSAFASRAVKWNYCRPELNDSFDLSIVSGRHAVIESCLPVGEQYVPNDLHLDTTGQQIVMITGPNMSGKSALLRQTALIVIMAQIGSYVPANAVSMGIFDKVFTRVGASDNMSQGESTFMVEMNETASILNNLSSRSLVVLDEIGRGTSTFDGISIAWAIAAYLHDHPDKPRTLFATHYHELNEMEKQFGRIRNYNVSIQELSNTILFLRKLVRGGSEHSFGLHVARMAGIPAAVLRTAGHILKQLEHSHTGVQLGEDERSSAMQLSIFQLDDPVLSQIKEEIRHIDINTLTPVEALLKLNEIKKLTGAK